MTESENRTESEKQTESENQFDAFGRYLLQEYDQGPPFSSFLPGIAGLHGIPMWVFYTNRGQAISGFGVESKDHPIMEFQPANKAYQLTDRLGFRTFLKGDGWYKEPFSAAEKLRREMAIGMNEVAIREVDHDLGLETRILYFNLINEPRAGLVRHVRFHNLRKDPLIFEVLDGMPALIPFGPDDDQLKKIGRTIEAWMEVFHLDSRIPFFHLRASAEDRSDVQTIEAGHFSFAASEDQLLPVFVDPQVVFGPDTAFSRPDGFLRKGLEGLSEQHQITEGRTPCSFFGRAVELPAGGQVVLSSVYGFSRAYDTLPSLAAAFTGRGFLEKKLDQARELAQNLTSPIDTHSAHPLFDQYCRQTFLDNIMRGGWPERIAGKHVYHVFSRKHGDMERDYNYFFLAAENYAQGNGNYRDVNQNRRCDVFFAPETDDFDIRLFMSLIQLDGYNPLVIKGTYFTLPQEDRAAVLAQTGSNRALEDLLSGPFTPGELLEKMNPSSLSIEADAFFTLVMTHARQHINAEFGEGYWVDHWLYNLDLIEAYLSINPEKKAWLLYDSPPLPFFDSPAVVNPREKKIVLEEGTPRQYHAVKEDQEKAALIESRDENAHWARAGHGLGHVFRLPLMSKLTLLALLKFASRDPLGLGIEMEAGKPGWYDALNGLPALFGSSMPESMSLLRLIDFLREAWRESSRVVTLPIEAGTLLGEVMRQIASQKDGFDYWNAVTSAREQYRQATRLGVDGALKAWPVEDLEEIFSAMQDRVSAGIRKAIDMGEGLCPTYFRYEAIEHAPTGEVDSAGRPFILPQRFKVSPLPDFLEGAVHQMKLMATREERKALYARVQESGLFDRKLGMVKINDSLQGQPHSIGRARAFSPGWLENESIWMHMSYKYLLEVLRAGLYEEYFKDMTVNMPPFMDPDTYGRSPLENVSFIVSSVHPDSALHGRGFVARLSGTTAEFLSIWFIMMTGGQPFQITEEGDLHFCLNPKIPGWLFPEDGVLSFTFLGHTRVRIHNPSREDTWKLRPNRYHLHQQNGDKMVTGEVVTGNTAAGIRRDQFHQIDLYLEIMRQ
jgi:hypothetical protein